MKNMKKTALTATAALLAIAGVAQAAPMELNIYGASAQYLFWSANAQNYAKNKLGCLDASEPVNNGGKHGFVNATNCTSTLVPVDIAATHSGNKRDIQIRYSGIASAEGPLAVKLLAPIDATLLQANKKADGTAGDGTGKTTAKECDQTKGERAMYDSASSLICKVVHIGTSDVAGESLTQSSTGMKLGPMNLVNGVNGATTTDVPITNNLGAGVNTSGLTPHSTVVVPFGFFANTNVKARQCTQGLVGNYCISNAGCNTTPTATDGVCNPTATTISNISRTQAAQIFSGQAADWSDFGSYFTPQQIVACLRHAGSGTHAAMQLTVMNGGGTGWGTTLAGSEDRVGAAGKLIDGGAAKIYFNNGSGDMMNCINGANTLNADNGAGHALGAIGYADADQANLSNTVALKYNGVYPTRSTLRNGLYEFYSAAQLYTNPLPARATVNAIAEDLITFAQDPANIPAVTGTTNDKSNYWASVAEMVFMRGADKGYPGFKGADFTCGAAADESCEQTP